MRRSIKAMSKSKASLCAILCLLVSWSSVAVANNAVILMYHHVSNETPPSTSISPQMFEQHLAYLAEHHEVVALETVVSALQQRLPLPDRAVVITFDDGYRNILDNAHAPLLKYQMPYTVFINPAVIGTRNDQLNWQQVKQMAEQGVTFANHTQYHNHLLQRLAEENQSQWLSRTMQDINDAQDELAKHLSNAPRYVAYPFGEFNQQLKDTLVAQGYVGFGQHSGAVGFESDIGALPRFPAAGIYANLNTLKTKLNSLAMPVQPDAIDPMQVIGSSPTVTISLTQPSLQNTQINCFFCNEALQVKRNAAEFSFTLPTPLGAGRSRVNCTAQSDQKGRFYWYSQPFFVADQDGRYPD